MKCCDISSGAARLELAMKSLRVTMSAVEEKWKDQAQRKFREDHLAPIEPTVRRMFDEISRMAEAIAAAERDCGPE